MRLAGPFCPQFEPGATAHLGRELAAPGDLHRAHLGTPALWRGRGEVGEVRVPALENFFPVVQIRVLIPYTFFSCLGQSLMLCVQ